MVLVECIFITIKINSAEAHKVYSVLHKDFVSSNVNQAEMSDFQTLQHC
jgi:hypothetical protein